MDNPLDSLKDPKAKKIVLPVAIGATLLVVFLWVRRGQSTSTAEFVTNPTGEPNNYGQSSGAGSSGSAVNPVTDEKPDVISTNDAWLRLTVERLVASGWDAQLATTALSKFLARNALTPSEVDIVTAGLGLSGRPPMDTPRHEIIRVAAPKQPATPTPVTPLPKPKQPTVIVPPQKPKVPTGPTTPVKPSPIEKPVVPKPPAKPPAKTVPPAVKVRVVQVKGGEWVSNYGDLATLQRYNTALHWPKIGNANDRGFQSATNNKGPWRLVFLSPMALNVPYTKG